ncbi:MAG: polysaccharide deacetylase family protein, partial [Legionellales bacterium]
TGFIIASEVHSDNWELLYRFRDAGFGLANHTWSHANLNRVTAKEYINEIHKADALLLPLLTQPKYFRYPYLAMGTGDKQAEIRHYLAKEHYQIAPITTDSKDFIFNQCLFSVPELGRRNYFDELKPFYLDFIWHQTLRAQEQSRARGNPDQAQILLIHANLLNAYALPDIIKMYKQRGYTFISLNKALNP